MVRVQKMNMLKNVKKNKKRFKNLCKLKSDFLGPILLQVAENFNIAAVFCVFLHTDTGS